MEHHQQQPPHPTEAGATGTIRRRPPPMKRNGSYPDLASAASEATETRPSRSRHAQTRPRAEHVHHHHHHHPVCYCIESMMQTAVQSMHARAMHQSDQKKNCCAYLFFKKLLFDKILGILLY